MCPYIYNIYHTADGLGIASENIKLFFAVLLWVCPSPANSKLDGKHSYQEFERSG